MKIVLAYSHMDASLAFRLLLWVKHLGGTKSPLFVVATKRASQMSVHQRIDAFLKEEFPDATHRVCATEDERGWPHSASHLFGECLEMTSGDDIFWLEPDCVPVRRGWFEKLHAEFRRANRTFVGCLVPELTGYDNTCPDHMTGCAFYGRNWRRYCPDLGKVKLKGMGAWDVDYAMEMMKDFHHTPMIQHRWVRHQADRSVDLSTVDAATELYHQCKDGSLFYKIDPLFATSALTQKWNTVTTGNIMTRYFLTENAAKPILAGGKTFVFAPAQFYPQANSWFGTLAIDDAADIEKLEPLIVSGRITELSEDDYQAFELKKKSDSSLRLSIKLQDPLASPSVQALVEPAAPRPALPPKPTVSLDEALAPKASRNKR